MKRFHVHINVADLGASIGFFRSFSALHPVRSGAIMTSGSSTTRGSISQSPNVADALTLAQVDTTCCYARPDKYWTQDPQGVHWELFRTLGMATIYSAITNEVVETKGASGCTPVVPKYNSCC